MESVSDAQPPPQSGPTATTVLTAAEEGQEQNGIEMLVTRVQELMAKIIANRENPNPNALHALSSILETQESRYMEETDDSTNNGKSTTNGRRLGKLIRENNEFCELITSTFLTGSTYSVSVQAATIRLLFHSANTWTYQLVFEDVVLENIRSWVINEIPWSSIDDFNRKHVNGMRKTSDFEMLRAYSTGCLALCLACGGRLVEDVLTSELPAKLMRYLRLHVLGETDSSKKDANLSMETVVCPKAREEGGGRLWLVTESSHLNANVLRKPPIEREHLDPSSLDNPHCERCISGQACDNECSFHKEPPHSMALEVDICEALTNGAEKSNLKEFCEPKTKPFGKSHKEEDFEENEGDYSDGQRTCRGLLRFWGKDMCGEGLSENDQALTCSCSGSRSGLAKNVKDRSVISNQDLTRTSDAKDDKIRSDFDDFILARASDDNCFQECVFGSKDITDLVIKAVRAAEAEARAANAPALALRAAGDAAAEVVKTAVLDEYRKTNDEKAAVVAASRATSAVIDAASAVALSRRSSTHVDDISGGSKLTERDINDDIGEFFILDSDLHAKLMDKFCIQCLAILGEYAEVIGPVLHEKGVDVSLALLHRSLKIRKESSTLLLLRDILKLISALAANRKFAELFVEHDGMLRLLAVPRRAQTFFGLSSCLFTIGSNQGVMERVCALPSNVVHQIVELALQLLECPQTQARKNAALFFTAAFFFRAVIDAFDAQEGLQKMLNRLLDVASVKFGIFLGPSSNPGSLPNEQSAAKVLTSSEKQIALQTSVALRQYFRAHLFLLVDSIHPAKNICIAPHNVSCVRASYMPLDISNATMNSMFRQIQKDQKLGPAFLSAHWPVVDKFISVNGHTTMLELSQVHPAEPYLEDMIQYALGVLQIVSLVPNSRKLIVNASLRNGGVGIAVILEAAYDSRDHESEIAERALNLLINIVCPPPSICDKPRAIMKVQQYASTLAGDRSAEAANIPCQTEPREWIGESSSANGGRSFICSSSSVGNTPSQASSTTVASGSAIDHTVSLGAGACSRLGEQLELGYRLAREAVYANDGIKILLGILQTKTVESHTAIDRVNTLVCQVLLGLARDYTIARILTKLQVEKKLSELIQDSGSQSPSGRQRRWQAELAQVATELIWVLANSGRPSTSTPGDYATPIWRRMERASVVACSPISYHPRELLLLIHEHLQTSGLVESAATVLRESQLTPLSSLASPSSVEQEVFAQEASALQIQWPSGRAPCGFLLDRPKVYNQREDSSLRCDLEVFSSINKSLSSMARGHSIQPNLEDSVVSSKIKYNLRSQKIYQATVPPGIPSASALNPGGDVRMQMRNPVVLPIKRKLTDLNNESASLGKRLNTGMHIPSSPGFTSPRTIRRNGLHDLYVDADESTGSLIGQASSCQKLLNDPQPSGPEQVTLDSLVIEYLKHQHQQCPAPITTSTPLSLLHPHVCPEPKRSFEAPSNVASRLSTREFRSIHRVIHGRRKDRQFVYSKFKLWRTCRDDASTLLTCISFLGDSSRIAAGDHSGELKVFDSNSNSVLEGCKSHQFPLTLLQSHFAGENQLLISSSSKEVCLWDVPLVSGGPIHSFEGIRNARFSNSGSIFAALGSGRARKDILLYDVHTCQLDLTLVDTISSLPGHLYSHLHFSPSDSMVLWNGVLWDRRGSRPIHRFNQLTNLDGGGFHPTRNEVIINSEVWDLRKHQLLQSVPSLDQTIITFNASGDVIYAIMRRNYQNLSSWFTDPSSRSPLSSAFRTVDAVTYSDIATIPVNGAILDCATKPIDSFVGLITVDDKDDKCSSAQLYEIGLRRLSGDDPDRDVSVSKVEEDEGEDFESEDDDVQDEEIYRSFLSDMRNDDAVTRSPGRAPSREFAVYDQEEEDDEEDDDEEDDVDEEEEDDVDDDDDV